MALRPGPFALRHATRGGRGAWAVALCGFALLLASASRPASAQMLVNGGVVSGSIAVPFEEDSYTFSANVGEGFQLRVADVSGGGLFPRITLFDPGMAFVTSGSGEDVGSIITTAAATGTYTVVVDDASTFGDQTGDYDLYFALAPGANEGGALINGGVVSDTLDLGDLDSYTFAANAGESFQLRIADLSATSLIPQMWLYDPSGTNVTSGSGQDVGSIIGTATSTGTYTVVVTDVSTFRDQTGAYNLYFTLAPGANEGGALIDGVTRFDTIDLGDLDSYTFSASVGQNAEIVVTDTGGGALFPRVLLYGPTGAFITSASGGTTATILHAVAVDGIYTVVVADASTFLDETGPYSIVVNGAGAAPVPISPVAVVLTALLLAATGTLVLGPRRARCRAAR